MPEVSPRAMVNGKCLRDGLGELTPILVGALPVVGLDLLDDVVMLSKGLLDPP